MSDDPAERRRELANDMARKAIWAAELARRADANAQISPEDAAQARQAAGIDPATDTPPTATDQTPSDLTDVLRHDIAEVEVRGDIAEASRLKSVWLGHLTKNQ
jgi:hypothetical protein